MAARALLVVLGLLAGVAGVRAQSNAEYSLPDLPRDVSIADDRAVFAFVFRNLPGQVQVLPTENYLYFRFSRGGIAHAGNIRLAAADRDQGKLHFVYGRAPSDRRTSPPVKHVVLDAARGVAVERIAALAYRVTRDGRSIDFSLNDLSQAKPLAGLLRPDERLLGPIFDESSVRFFLVFNTRLKTFHYLLDEIAARGDEWAEAGDGLLIGKRSGFALYRDGDRKVLVGVRARDSRLNTPFDGPFDQLPENFVEGDNLRDAIVASDPSVRDKIDRLGHFSDGSGRYLIHPYMLYRTAGDLAVFHRCMTAKYVPVSRRALCFVISNAEAGKKKPLPLALKRR